VFFGGHILHRSKRNFTTDRVRRSFVGHYCNARSFTQWGEATEPGSTDFGPTVEPATGMTNGSHILACGDTHLPFARPRFGTPCAALLSADDRRCTGHGGTAAMMGDMDSGMMDALPSDPYAAPHDHDETR
jgi:hypothetical protein